MRSLLFSGLLLLATTLPFSLAQATVTGTVVQNPSTTTSIPPNTTLATSTTAPPTSIIQATRTQSGYAAATSNSVDSAGGGEGSSDSWGVSKGGMIAIIVVVVGVAVFGVVSIVLFVVAKRRQWNVRASIKRASRRLTGRDPGPKPSEVAARKKRSGMVAGSRGDTGEKFAPRHKRGLVVEVKDEERGPLDYPPPPKTTKSRGGGLMGRLGRNDWK